MCSATAADTPSARIVSATNGKPARLVRASLLSVT
jgi:hypothetical protein